MNYQQTLAWMFEQLPMYQHQGKTAFKKDLTNIILLTDYLDHPERKFKSLHVAGTNGKGSTCHMLASILQEAGYKTGLHTSPHLKDFRERIRINGKMISEEEVVNFIAENKSFFEANQLSFFEMSVGMAFDYFAKEQVDIAIIETGMGGRLDSTNIINPELAVITNIGFDHMAILGNTLPEIATEKAGIIKPSIPVVIGEKNEETAPVFIRKAAETNSPIYFAEEDSFPEYQSDLKGTYQKQNIQAVLKAVELLQVMNWKIDNKAIKNGLLNVQENTGLQGRWQQLGENPYIFCDTGHNKNGLAYVLKQLTNLPHAQLHIVLGVVDDKDLSSILPMFPKNALYYFCKADVPRGLHAEILAETAEGYGLLGKVYPSVKQALEAAKKAAEKTDLIFIGGSTFTVAEII